VSAAPDPPPAVVVTDAIQAGLLPWHLADTFDDETTGFYWWGGDELYALAILIGDEPYVFFGDALRVAADQLCAIAEDPARELIGFNIKFDFHFLRERAIQLRARVLDASVALFLLDENKWSGQSHGLKHAVKQIFGFEMVEFKDMLGYVTEETGEFRTRKCKGCGGKGWRSRAHVVCDVCGGACVESTPKTRRRMRRIDEVPLEVVARYAGHDAWFTKQVWLWAHARLSQKPKLWRNFDEVQMPLLRSLYFMEHRGIRIDREATEALHARFTAEIQEIDAAILARTGCRVVGATAIDDDGVGEPGADRAVLEGAVEERPDAEVGQQLPGTRAAASPGLRASDDSAGSEDRVEDLRHPTLEVNLDSPAQTDWFLYSFLGLKRPPFRPQRKAKDGSRVASKYQTDENCLLYVWKHQGQEIPKLLWRRRKLAKYVGTYLNNMLQFAQPRLCNHSDVSGHMTIWVLYPNFNQTAARTGRLSSSKPLNFQNIPHDAQFRCLFIARPGCVAENQIFLQLFEISVPNPNVTKLPETGCDAIDRFLAFDPGFDQ